MTISTVIIAHRRRGQDYWDGYEERAENETKGIVSYYRSIGRIVKVFPSIVEYRADCNKKLDKWEAKKILKRNGDD